jgi:hypothetical protein
MAGWSSVAFRREPDGRRVVLPIDLLIRHLGDWGRR